jgi:aminoglycoside 3-N-acetyltransferase
LPFAAWGRHTAWIAAEHSLNHPFGETSPLAKTYDLDGRILLLGVTHSNNTSLHLAET